MKETSTKNSVDAALSPAASREIMEAPGVSMGLDAQRRLAAIIDGSPRMAAQGHFFSQLESGRAVNKGMTGPDIKRESGPFVGAASAQYVRESSAPVMQRQVIQLDAVEDLSGAVNTAYATRNLYPAMRGTGTTRWPQDTDFIIAGAKGTFHHIVNKEQLRGMIKGYIWLRDKLKNAIDPDDYNHDELGDTEGAMTATSTAIDDFFAKVGNPNGDSVRGFYWRKDNGFIGVRADYRHDNPDGMDNEGRKPTSMPSDAWDNSLAWYARLGELSAAASGINTTNESVKATLENLTAKLNDAEAATDAVAKDGTPHRTDDSAEAENTDWKKQDDAEQEWGSANKIYELK